MALRKSVLLQRPSCHTICGTDLCCACAKCLLRRGFLGGQWSPIIHSLNQRNVLPEGMSWVEFKKRLQANLVLFPMGGAQRVNLLTEDLLPSDAAFALARLSKGARLLIADPLRQLHLEDEN